MPQWGFGMPPPGFMDLIAQKYAIQQQEANARSNALNASAAVDTAKAAELPAESAANVAETRARTGTLNTTNRFLPFTLGSSALASMGQASLSNAEATKTGVETKGLLQLQQPFSAAGLGLLDE